MAAGKRLDSLSQFCQVTKEVIKEWKPQHDITVVGDVILAARSSTVTIAGKELTLPGVEAALFKFLVRNAGNPTTRNVVLAGVIVLLLTPPLVHDARFDLLIQKADTRTLAYEWLAQHVRTGAGAAIPYLAGPAHDQAMVEGGEHSHGAQDPYVASFLDGRLETQYPIRELSSNDFQLTSLDSFRQQDIRYLVVAYERPGTGCRPDSPLEHALLAEGPPLASFSPTAGCPASVFDPIDSYYVPLAGYGGWIRPGPHIRIYRLRD